MKVFFRSLEILLIGLAVAVLIYPFLHEMGHLLAAVLTGAEVIDVQLFPTPYIDCNVSSIGAIPQCLIGISGMLFPFSVSFLLRKQPFRMWLTSLLLKGISLLAFLLSGIAILAEGCGGVWVNEDIVRVAAIWEPFHGFWAVSMAILMLLCAVSIYNQHPIIRLRAYCEVEIYA